MKVLGIDLGSKTVGLAVSDYLEIIANPIGTIRIPENDLDTAITEINKVIKENNIGRIVLGLPKNMNGSVGFQGEYCLKFKDMLIDKYGIPVVMFDERLTSKIANQVMLSADMSRRKRKMNVDKLAATVILQDYLDSTAKR